MKKTNFTLRMIAFLLSLILTAISIPIAIIAEDGENIIRIEASDVQEIANNINKLAKTKKLESPILAVPMDIRHMCFVILSEFVPNIRVLACEELVSDYNIKFIGKV